MSTLEIDGISWLLVALVAAGAWTAASALIHLRRAAAWARIAALTRRR